MEYEKGYVYKLMDEGGPTDNREPLILFFIDYVAVMILFALLGALAVYLLGKLSKKLPRSAAHAKND